jgi:hypothetical protein
MILDNASISFLYTNTVVLSDSTADCDTIPVGTGGSVFWFFEADRDVAKRSGLYMTTWNADSSAADLVVLATDSYDEYGLGDSTDLTFTLVIEGGNVILRATSVNNWTITVKRLKI